MLNIASKTAALARGALFAAILLLCAPLAAEDRLDGLAVPVPGPDSGRGPGVPSTAVGNWNPKVVCANQDFAYQLQQEANRAMDKVDSCLGKLSPALATKIKKEFSLFDFDCDSKNSAEGGWTSFTGNGRVRIALNMINARGVKQFSLEERVFHELIHAVDDPIVRGFLLSKRDHATIGFPDVPWSCQFACYGSFTQDEVVLVVGDENNDWLVRHGVFIPQQYDYPQVYGFSVPGRSCGAEEKSGDCIALRRYAYVCHVRMPASSPAWLKEARERELPTCLAEEMINKCMRPVCEGLRRDFVAKRKTRKDLENTMAGLLPFLAPGSTQTSPAKDSDLVNAAKKGGFYDACMNPPTGDLFSPNP